MAGAKERWAALSTAERARLLGAARRGVLEVAEAWVAEANRRREIAPDAPAAGEEWLAGPLVTLRALRQYEAAMRAGGRPRPHALRRRPDGGHVADVFPSNALDRLLYSGISAELHIAPGDPPTQGAAYRAREQGGAGPGSLALVLGAGNVSSIAPLDALSKLIREDQVVVLKTSPVNAWLGPYLERAFSGFIEGGFLRIVAGGAAEGARLAMHPEVDTVHLTGSIHTWRALVWGADPDERRRRQAAGTPRLAKPSSAELGAVTPVLVVPGPWSDDDLAFQARHVAAMVAHNASFNCNAAQLVVLARGWAGRDAFLDRLRQALAEAPPRHAYYPGAFERYEAFRRRYPRAKALGRGGPGVVPWTLIPDVMPSAEEYALREEAFCGVLAEVSVEADDAESFLDRATALADEAIRGTLSCCVLVHPETARRHAAAVEGALDRLRYGSIGVNVWPGVGFALPETSWGAYPTPAGEESFSGRGVVHDTYLFDHPEKSIVRAPFRIRPTPPWFHDHRTLARLAPRLARFEGDRRWRRLPGIAALAARG